MGNPKNEKNSKKKQKKSKINLAPNVKFRHFRKKQRAQGQRSPKLCVFLHQKQQVAMVERHHMCRDFVEKKTTGYKYRVKLTSQKSGWNNNNQ